MAEAVLSLFKEGESNVYMSIELIKLSSRDDYRPRTIYNIRHGVDGEVYAYAVRLRKRNETC